MFLYLKFLGIFAALFQAESKAKLESKLIGLSSLTKPQLLTVNQVSYPLNLRNWLRHSRW